jgi:hypothetical protein
MPGAERKAWPKKDEGLIRRIDGLLATAPVKRKNFFGTVAWFLESNDLIFAGAWGEGVFMRIGEAASIKSIAAGEADPHNPTGHRRKREYVFLERSRIENDVDLLDWFKQATEFVGALPPNTHKIRRTTNRGKK